MRPGDTVLVGTGAAEPRELIEHLICAAESIPGGVRVIQIMAGGQERLAKASGTSVHLMTPVPGKLSRVAIAEGRAQLLRQSIGEILDQMDDGRLRIDGVLLQGRMDGPQHATPGLCSDIVVPAWAKARFRAIELNAAAPYIFSNCRLDLNEADIVLHTDYAVGEMPNETEGVFSSRIGNFVADCVVDGATIEMGIGRTLAGIPKALIATRRDLAMHTGRVGDWAMDLIEAGCVSRQIRGRAVAVGAAAIGTSSFYQWADANRSIAIVDSQTAHNVRHLAAQQKFTAINGVLEVDLTGSANSSVKGGMVVSGAGGAKEFARAGASAHGSIVVLSATTTSGKSRIVPRVEFETLSCGEITHVVTEFGVARIKGLSRHACAHALISIADPRHRDSLEKAIA